tara:strand:+ start:3323 stop:3472 length:150 start_codon:yes stop_codon:yes gene_type:complete
MIRPIFADLKDVRDEMKAFLERADSYASLSGQGDSSFLSQIGDSQNRLK